MSSITIFLLALFASILSTFAAPVPVDSAGLQKRTTHDGKATWFEVGLGACGFTNVDTDPIIALSTARYGSGGNCNQWVHITNTANGQSTYAQTRDECPGCGENDLDLSPSAFEAMGTLDEGVLPIEWHFMNKDWSP